MSKARHTERFAVTTADARFTCECLTRLPSRKFAVARAAYRRAALATTRADLDELVRANIGYTLAYYRRLFALCVDPSWHRLRQQVEVHNLDLLANVLERKLGAVLVTAHLGDFDLAGWWLAESLGVPVVGMARRLRPWHTPYAAIRRRCGLIVRHEGETEFADLVRDVSCGHIVVLMVDRAAASGVEIDFFDIAARIPVLPYLLSRRTGAPIITVAATSAQGSHRLRFANAYPDAAAIPRHEVTGLLQAVVNDLEQVIRLAPEQWHLPAQLAHLPWSATPDAALTLPCA